MRLLDLFCKAGGAAMGYHRAGFDEIVGIDIEHQKQYPFEFVQCDALEYVRDHWMEFDAIHASPPCQAYSTASFKRPNRGIVAGGTLKGKHPDLFNPTRHSLERTCLPWVIENVVGSPAQGITLCGLMFGLKMFRHRKFETNFFCMTQSHRSHSGKRVGQDGFVTMVGDGDSLRKRNGSVPADHRSKVAWQKANGIDWMSKDEMSQAIPPAYTEFIGKQLISHIKSR